MSGVYGRILYAESVELRAFDLYEVRVEVECIKMSSVVSLCV